MEFRILDRSEHHLWNEFVDTSPQGSIYAKSYYLDCVKCPYLIAVIEKGNTIRGGIILAKNELGVHANPLFVKYLGILYSPQTLKKPGDTYKVDNALLRNLSCRGIWSYSFHPGFTNWLNFYWKDFRQTTCYTYQIHFSETEDFRSRFGEKVKAPLRATHRHQLSVEDTDIETLLELDQATYTARNTKPPYGRDRMVEMLQGLVKHECIYMKCVKCPEGNVHAAAAIVYDRKTANLIFNGSRSEYRKFGGNSFLIDHMIEYSSSRFEIFDFEGSMHQRIESFYRGFGGDLTPYFLITKRNVLSFTYEKVLALYKRIAY